MKNTLDYSVGAVNYKTSLKTKFELMAEDFLNMAEEKSDVDSDLSNRFEENALFLLNLSEKPAFRH